jgi:hypothetical protein
MSYNEDLSRLNRHVLLSSLLSIGVILFGFLGLVLYIEPAWLHAWGMYNSEITLLVVGILLISFGIAFLFISIDWPNQLKRTVLNSRPTRMMIKLEVEKDTDSTTYYAVINRRSAKTAGNVIWRAHIWVYPPKIEEDIGREVEGDVFLHPKTGLPLAIKVAKGILWVISGNGAVRELSVLDH